MLQRKFTSVLEHYLTENTNKILLVNSARQIGKSYLIRYVGKKLYRHYVEINLQDDKNNQAIVFSNEPKVYEENGIWYMPIYFIMFLQQTPSGDVILPPLEMPNEAYTAPYSFQIVCKRRRLFFAYNSNNHHKKESLSKT